MSKKSKRTPEQRKQVREEQRRIESELCRRVDASILSYLQLSRKDIIYILNHHNIDSISLEEVKNWLTIPQIAPDHGKRIVEMAMRKRLHYPESLQIFTENQQEQKRIKEDMAQYDLMEKLRRKQKLSFHEQYKVEDDGFFLVKCLVGVKPSEALELYKDDEYSKLLAKYFDIDLSDHTTYPAHLGSCDMDGKDESCEERIEKHKEQVKEWRRYNSGMKEISILTNDIQKGDYVLFYYDSKIGVVKRVNKVSYTVEGIGKAEDAGLMTNYKTSPDWLKKINLKDYPSYDVGDEVMAKCVDGRTRQSKIIEKRDECFYLIEHYMPSKKMNSYCWIDCSRFMKE